ncbi:MAG TPA: alpha/beta hydrolase [Acidimicrobiales bacterium]|jgi:acetyl esterase/lipase|nr:alpha/beta hydrolase [Acidimicrobiales bacterium]
MGWVLLALGSVSALFTVNARYPSRNRWLVAPSFFASWLTIELAPQLLLGQAAIAAVLCVFGALGSAPGWVGLVLCALSWVGLLAMVAQAQRSASTMRAALVDTIGAEAGSRLSRGALLMPFVHRAKGVASKRNIVFARAGGRRLTLDVFHPVDMKPGDRRPTILQIHGGAWVLGFRQMQSIPLRNHLVANGWVWVDTDYRLAPAAGWPDFLVDCKRALAWTREHAEEWGIDPDFVCVTGNSAGGHLSSLVALTQNDPRYQPGFEDADTSVQGAVPIYGVYDFTNRNRSMHDDWVPTFLEPWVMKAFHDEQPDLFRDASPIDQANADAPPMLVVHGDRDTLAPVADARTFVDAVRAASRQPVLYAELHGAQHAFDMFPSLRSLPVVEAIERFLHWVHTSRLEADPAAKSPPKSRAVSS